MWVVTPVDGMQLLEDLSKGNVALGLYTSVLKFLISTA